MIGLRSGKVRLSAALRLPLGDGGAGTEFGSGLILKGRHRVVLPSLRRPGQATQLYLMLGQSKLCAVKSAALLRRLVTFFWLYSCGMHGAKEHWANGPA